MGAWLVPFIPYFGGIMRYDAKKPTWPGRGHFIPSKGHEALRLCAVLAEATTLMQSGSPLEGHPNMRRLPGVEALPRARSVRVCQSTAVRRWPHRQPGLSASMCFSAMARSAKARRGKPSWPPQKYKVGNLVAIVYHNGYQQTGSSRGRSTPARPNQTRWVREVCGPTGQFLYSTWKLLWHMKGGDSRCAALQKQPGSRFCYNPEPGVEPPCVAGFSRRRSGVHGDDGSIPFLRPISSLKEVNVHGLEGIALALAFVLSAVEPDKRPTVLSGFKDLVERFLREIDQDFIGFMHQ